MPNPLARYCLAASLLLASTTIGLAQEGDDDGVYELSPFVVDPSDNEGYRATNTIAGTMLNTELKESPFAIDVFTEALMEDLGADDFREVLEYDSGAVLDNAYEQGFGTGGFENGDNVANADTQIKVRGFPVEANMNGFLQLTRIDTAGIGRIEKANGPSGLLYGVGALSGSTNSISKMPSPERRYSTRLSVGSDSYLRGTFDATGPIAEKLNYRFIAAYTEEDDPVVVNRDEKAQYYSFILGYDPFETTNLIVELSSNSKDRNGHGQADIDYGTDNPVTGVDQYWQKGYFGLGRGGANISAIEQDDYTSNVARVEWTQDLGKNLKFLLAAQTEDFERDFLNVANPRLMDDETKLVAALQRGTEERRHDQFRLSILNSFYIGENKHDILVGRFESSLEVDTPAYQPYWRFDNQIGFPELTKGANDWDRPLLSVNSWGAGASVADHGVYTPARSTQTINQWLTGHYIIHQGEFFKGKLKTTAGYRWERTHDRRIETIASGFGVRQRDNNRDGMIDFDDTNEYRTQDIWPQTHPTGDYGSLEPGKRNTVVFDEGGTVVDPLKRRLSTRDGYSNKGKPKESGVPTAGLSYALTDELNAYALYSEGLALPKTAQRDGFGEAFDPQHSTNKELGLKFNLLKNKISGSFAVFNVLRENAVRYAWYAPNPSRGNFNPDEPVTYEVSSGLSSASGGMLEARTYSWSDPADRADLIAAHVSMRNQGLDGIAGAGGNNPGRDRGSYLNFDEESEGYELRFDLNLIENLALKVSYTHNDVIITEPLNGMVDAAWDNGIHFAYSKLGESNFANGPDLSDPSSFERTDYQMSSFVNYLDEVKKSDTPENRFTLWSRYDFDEGLLGGSYVTFGAKYSSERIQFSPYDRNDRPESGVVDFDFPTVPDNWLFDLGLGYQWATGDTDWRIDLNVYNLLDEQKLSETKVDPANDKPYTALQYLNPRSFRLSVTATF